MLKISQRNACIQLVHMSCHSVSDLFQIVIQMGQEKEGMMMIRAADKQIMCPTKYLAEV